MDNCTVTPILRLPARLIRFKGTTCSCLNLLVQFARECVIEFPELSLFVSERREAGFPANRNLKGGPGTNVVKEGENGLVTGNIGYHGY